MRAGSPEAGVRLVADDEVQHFAKAGWVLLPGLVSPDFAASLLEKAKARLGRDAISKELPGGAGSESRFYRKYMNIGRKDEELFWSFATDETLGENASRLLGRQSTIRLMTEFLAVKLPESQGAIATDWHQDWHSRAIDRVNVTVWLALDDIPPEKGSMRFYDGSQALGPLGMAEHQQKMVSTNADAVARREASLPEVWPRLAECALSEPIHLRPGDATIHSSLVVHGAPSNITDDPRWVYILSLNPGDAIYRGGPQYMYNAINLQPGEVIDHPNFPVIYAPELVSA